MEASNIKYLVIHCSATRSNQDYTLEDLERDHHARGFRSIGYHFYIRRDGIIYALRRLNEVGAHTRGYNRRSIGICYEGGLDENRQAADTRTEAQRAALKHLLYDLHKRFPWAEIVGHRDLSPDIDGNGRIDPREWTKQCPCFDAREEYAPILHSALGDDYGW